MSLGGTRSSNSKWITKTDQIKILVHRLIFASYHLTSLDLCAWKLQFSLSCFVTTRPSAVCMYDHDQKNLGATRHLSSKWRMKTMKTKQIQTLLNMFNLFFSNTLLPLTSWPVTCKHVPLHATCLHIGELTKQIKISVNIIHSLFPDTIVPLTSSPVNCKHQATSM
jgi:hypothetical protein